MQIRRHHLKILFSSHFIPFLRFLQFTLGAKQKEPYCKTKWHSSNKSSGNIVSSVKRTTIVNYTCWLFLFTRQFASVQMDGHIPNEMDFLLHFFYQLNCQSRVSHRSCLTIANKNERKDNKSLYRKKINKKNYVLKSITIILDSH